MLLWPAETVAVLVPVSEELRYSQALPGFAKYCSLSDRRTLDLRATSMRNYQMFVSRFLVMAFLILAYPGANVFFADEPAQPAGFEQAGIIKAWNDYRHKLTFGRSQTLALVDDGCNLSMPEWSRSDGD